MNKKRINEFLENMEEMYDSRINTDLPLSQNEIYSWLVRINSIDDHKDISELFNTRKYKKGSINIRYI